MMRRMQFILIGICYKILQRLRQSGRSNASDLAVFANDDLGLRIACFGEFETEILSFLRQNLPVSMQDKVLVDIGANLGNHSNGLSAHFRHCHAFEADPRTFRLLNANMADKTNVTCHEMAISDSVGTVTFAPNQTNTGKSHIVDIGNNFVATETTAMIDVPSHTLDSLDCFDHPIGFIKIDVEGHELQVLHGAKHLLLHQKPFLLIELLATDIADGKAASLEYLKNLGYAQFSSIEQITIQIDAIANIPVLRWINHVLHAVEILLMGTRPAKMKALDPEKLTVKNYDAIFVTL